MKKYSGVPMLLILVLLSCSRPFQLEAKFGIVDVSPGHTLSTSENGDSASFTVSLKKSPKASVIIPVTSSDASRGTVNRAVLVFTTSDWNRPQTVMISGVDDGTLSDGSHEYAIILGPIQSEDGDYEGQRPRTVKVINVDNDVPGIYATPVAGLNTSESGGTGTFKMKLTVEPTASVRVTIQSGNLSEGRIRQTSGACSVSGTIVTTTPCYVDFTPANWNVEQDIVAQGVNDALTDGNVNYAINSISVVSADSRYNSVTLPTVTLTNTDDDVPSVSVSVTSGNLFEAGDFSFQVSLTTAPSVALDINLSSSNTGEGQIRQSAGNCSAAGTKSMTGCKLTFTPANWATPQTVTIDGIDDGSADGNAGFSIILDTIVTADPDYAGMNPPDVIITSIDNGVPGFIVSPSSGLVTTESGGTANFSIRLQSQPTSIVALALTSSNTAEGSVSPAALSFTTGNWSTPQNVTITGVADNRIDENANYQIMRQITTGSGHYAPEGIPVGIVSLTNNNTDSGKFIFVTNSPRTGGASLGSQDTRCNSDTAKPPNGSTYKAVVGAEAGDDTTVQRDYTTAWVLYPSQKYYRAVDGRLIGQTDSSARFTFNLINSFHNTSVVYWTGLTSGFGTAGLTYSCKTIGTASWSSNLGSIRGGIGNGSATDSRAISDGDRFCNNNTSVYILCAEQ